MIIPLCGLWIRFVHTAINQKSVNFRPIGTEPLGHAGTVGDPAHRTRMIARRGNRMVQHVSGDLPPERTAASAAGRQESSRMESTRFEHVDMVTEAVHHSLLNGAKIMGARVGEIQTEITPRARGYDRRFLPQKWGRMVTPSEPGEITGTSPGSSPRCTWQCRPPRSPNIPFHQRTSGDHTAVYQAFPRNIVRVDEERRARGWLIRAVQDVSGAAELDERVPVFGQRCGQSGRDMIGASRDNRIA